MIRQLGSALALGLLLFACQCGSAAQSDCIDQCESHKKCGLLESTDCGAACDASTSSAEEGGCVAQLDALSQCLSPDYCVALSKCDTQNEAYAMCISK